MTTKVTRKEITLLSDEEMDRFVVAMKGLTNSPDYARIAGLHGGGWGSDNAHNQVLRARATLDWNEPTPPSRRQDSANPTLPASFFVDYAFCNHHGEDFSLWHRPYIEEFEFLLQQYDPWKDDSRKPRLGLPYWAWEGAYLKAPFPIPKVLSTRKYKMRTNQFPSVASIGVEIDNPLFSAGKRPDFGTGLNGRTDGVKTTRQPNTRLLRLIAGQLAAARAEPNFLKFYTYRNTPATSIEQPHDYIHGSIGGDMGDPATAAFDPIFWLHHCNVDRQIFLWQVAHSGQTSPPPSINRPLHPFTATLGEWQTSATAASKTPSQVWSVASLRYVYGNPPAAFPTVPRIPPVAISMGAFRARDVIVKVTVPVCLASGVLTAIAPDGKVVAVGCRFVNTSGMCPACVTVGPTTVSLEVTSPEVLPQSHPTLKIFLGDEELQDTVIKVQFANDLRQGGDDNNADERIHPKLRRLGLLEDDETTQKGLDKLVKIARIVKPGLASAEEAVNSCGHCMGKHHSLSRLVDGAQANTHVTLSVGFFGRAAADERFGKAAKAATAWWEAQLHGQVSFEMTESFANVDIVVSFEPLDGIGKVLGFTSHAHGDRDVVNIAVDDAEDWTTARLTRMLSHELGHALGYPHNNYEANSIMFPFESNVATPELTKNDRSVFRK